MYSIRKEIQAPEGAKTFSDIEKNSMRWKDAELLNIAGQAKQIKKKFSEMVLE